MTFDSRRVFGGCGIEQTDLSCFQGGDWHPIAEQETICAENADSWSGRENARKVQRVRAADDDHFSFSRILSERPQQADCFRQSKLLAADAADKVASSNFALSFDTPINTAQIVP